MPFPARGGARRLRALLRDPAAPAGGRLPLPAGERRDPPRAPGAGRGGAGVGGRGARPAGAGAAGAGSIPPEVSPAPSFLLLSPDNMAAKSDGGGGGPAVLLESPEGGGGRREAGAEPPARRYRLRDGCWVFCALLVCFADGASDLWLAAHYYVRGQRWWFGLTLLFVLLPSLVVQMLSLRWFVYDFAASTKDSGGGTKDSGPRGCCRLCVWLLQGLIHLLQLGQVWRYGGTRGVGVPGGWGHSGDGAAAGPDSPAAAGAGVAVWEVWENRGHGGIGVIGVLRGWGCFWA